ncbi:MAG TPA: hypothetical protein VFY71_03045 [Planctomycetota bacterium]|nr:hypothetical protein [Planctomycetota bacterium]
MKTLLPFGALLLVACATTAAGQQAAAPAKVPDTVPGVPPELPVIAADQLVLEYMTLPDSMDRDVLSSLIRLNRRQIMVRNADGSLRGPLENCQDADSGMLVYDTADYVKGVKLALAKVVGEAPAGMDAPVMTEVYVPRFVAVQRLFSVLQPLQRTIATRASAHQPWEQHSNVSFQSSPAMIVINDTQDQVARMLELLRRVDNAPPQMLITCWLVRGSFEEQSGARELPSDLVDNLRRLLPYHEYGLVTTALVRTSILAGEERSLRGSFGQDSEFQLQLQPGAVDESGHRLAFERIEFKSSEGAQFDTSAVVDFNEYTVLGAAGANPLLVVLQVKPVQD